MTEMAKEKAPAHEVAIATKFCSICEPCEDSLRIKEGDTWIDATPLEFCTTIVETNESCGDCLTRLDSAIIYQ